MDGIESIIRQLEEQRNSVERAIAALREISGGQEPVITRRRGRRPSPKNPSGGSEMETANARSEGQRRRWAEKRVAAMAGPGKGRGLTEAGRKHLSEMMKARWAAKKRAGKKLAAKKRV